MPDTDAPKEPSAASRPSSRPSLISNAASQTSVTNGTASTLRMLEGLDSAGRPRFEPADAAPPLRWKKPAALIVLAIVATALWWWSQRQRLDAAPSPEVAARHAPPSTVAAAPPAASQPASAASEAVAPDSSVARVENVVEEAAPAALAAGPAEESASAPVAKAPSVPTVAPSPPLPALKAAAVKPGATKPRVVAIARASDAANDADVALLSALLKHIERDGASEAASPQTRLTIAQLVHRCDGSAGQQDASESVACKRRICEGYWGKAEACPRSLAPVPKKALPAGSASTLKALSLE